MKCLRLLFHESLKMKILLLSSFALEFVTTFFLLVPVSRLRGNNYLIQFTTTTQKTRRDYVACRFGDSKYVADNIYVAGERMCFGCPL